MACDEAWKRFRELGVECARVHQAYAALVGSPEFTSGLALTPEESRAIDEAAQRCTQCDTSFQAARLTAIAEQHEGQH